MAENIADSTPGTPTAASGGHRAALAIWAPQFRLRLTTPRLELRVPDENDLRALAELVADQGIHAPGAAPFQGGWSNALPQVVAGRVLQYLWKGLALSRPGYWNLGLAVFLDGRPVGVQGLQAREFPKRGEVATESWLARGHQGRGIGTEMRTAALRLAFAGLGARYATSAVFEDGAAALAVNKKLGYQPDGIEVHDRQGEPTVLTRWRMTRAQWELSPAAEATAEIHGLDACRALFGSRPHDTPSARQEPA
ncbi:GNAT family N-acetyltransferase [Streptomyces dysideae]|uniref:GNAT family N-acetyltransferase n=1 Tax=Streptomyces dysideae TaxID=909626 RepID=UPI00099ECE2D|nr:GNAT family protein [Streptomyces dysideae]